MPNSFIGVLIEATEIVNFVFSCSNARVQPSTTCTLTCEEARTLFSVFNSHALIPVVSLKTYISMHMYLLCTGRQIPHADMQVQLVPTLMIGSGHRLVVPMGVHNKSINLHLGECFALWVYCTDDS